MGSRTLDRWLKASTGNPDLQLELLCTYHECASRRTRTGQPCRVMVRTDRGLHCRLHDQ